MIPVLKLSFREMWINERYVRLIASLLNLSGCGAFDAFFPSSSKKLRSYTFFSKLVTGFCSTCSLLPAIFEFTSAVSMSSKTST